MVGNNLHLFVYTILCTVTNLLRDACSNGELLYSFICTKEAKAHARYVQCYFLLTLWHTRPPVRQSEPPMSCF
jgi:hypothetical protein